MSSDALMLSLLTEFKCPTCNHYMHPPIRYCIKGHSLCKNCSLRLDICPTCNHNLRKSSSLFILENLHAKLTFPCRFSDKGCKLNFGGHMIESHERDCIHGQSQCPLRAVNRCSWMGRSRSLVAHCRSNHPKNTFFSNVQRLTCPNFIRTRYRTSTAFYMIFYTYKQLFKCIWQVDYETGIMKWCVYTLVADKSDALIPFYYLIEIIDGSDLRRKLVLQNRCPLLEVHSDHSINHHEYVLSHYDMVRTFCIDDVFTYYIKIYPKRLCSTALDG